MNRVPRMSKTDRRAVVLVAMVLVLAMLHLLVMGSLAPTKSEAELAGLRVETVRAFYAAESGAMVVIRRLIDNGEPMAAGDEIDLGGSRVVFLEWPTDSGGPCVIEGRSGRAVRRLRLEFGP